jgi:hypothetical protein
MWTSYDVWESKKCNSATKRTDEKMRALNPLLDILGKEERKQSRL